MGGINWQLLLLALRGYAPGSNSPSMLAQRLAAFQPAPRFRTERPRLAASAAKPRPSAGRGFEASLADFLPIHAAFRLVFFPKSALLMSAWRPESTDSPFGRPDPRSMQKIKNCRVPGRTTVILARLEQADDYLALHRDFAAAIAFLRSQPLGDLPQRRIEIAETIYAMVFRSPTRQRSEARLKAHRKHIDIQYLISGVEEMGWSTQPLPAAARRVRRREGHRVLWRHARQPVQRASGRVRDLLPERRARPTDRRGRGAQGRHQGAIVTEGFRALHGGGLLRRRDPGFAHAIAPSCVEETTSAPRAWSCSIARRASPAQLDAAAGVVDNPDRQPQGEGVQGRRLHAVVGGQAADVNRMDAAGGKIRVQAGRTPPRVVEESAVAVDVGVNAFAEDAGDAGAVEAGMQLGARRVLHAMHRPEDLRQAGQLDFLARTATRMVGGEAAVVGRMPVLRGDDEAESPLARLIAGTTRSPSDTGSAPPGQKSFCTSTTIRAIIARGQRLYCGFFRGEAAAFFAPALSISSFALASRLPRSRAATSASSLAFVGRAWPCSQL